MNRLLALDEGREHVAAPRRRSLRRTAPVPSALPTPPPALPDGITPELIEMARKLKAAGLG
jgi:hypothetical protein